MSSPSAISSQTILIRAEASAQLWPGGQLAHAFTAFCFYCPIIPKVFPKPSSPCCSSPEPIAGSKVGPRAFWHLSDTIWVKHLVPMHEEGEACLQPPSSAQPCPCRAVAPAPSPGSASDAWLQFNHFPGASSSPPAPGEGMGIPFFQALKAIPALEVPG